MLRGGDTLHQVCTAALRDRGRTQKVSAVNKAEQSGSGRPQTVAPGKHQKDSLIERGRECSQGSRRFIIRGGLDRGNAHKTRIQIQQFSVAEALVDAREDALECTPLGMSWLHYGSLVRCLLWRYLPFNFPVRPPRTKSGEQGTHRPSMVFRLTLREAVKICYLLSLLRIVRVTAYTLAALLHGRCGQTYLALTSRLPPFLPSSLKHTRDASSCF